MADNQPNAYTLLELEVTATEAEIRKAYRQRSLKVHPDRHPNNPQAAQRFHELNTAYELLLDPIQKTALDTKIKAQQAKKLRFSAYDNKRKAMMEELEKSERDFKKSRMEAEKERENTMRDEERIKEEGRRMMKEREERLMAKEVDKSKEAKGKEKERVDEAPLAGSLDTTVRLKYILVDHPTLSTSEALGGIMQAFGTVDMSSIIISIKPNKKNPSKPAKNVTALVPFTKIAGAFSAVMGSGRKDKGLGGIDIGWAGGQEPGLVTWLKNHGQLGSSIAQRSSSDGMASFPPAASLGTSSAPFSSFPDDLPLNPQPQKPSPPSGIDFESLTFMRMRQAERERLEREILEAEAHEGHRV
ncbi:hypothetical protein FRB93_006049 [Tulasnella sp. JGI-2019a]|nr:hypothetical protein FRB93_006049 [Tulasnella sp. JGI-2019a]